jgi:DNA-binding response OmpR family regulator
MKNKKKILIIEDEIFLTQALQTYFGLYYDIHIAYGGKDGLSMIYEIIPDLILLDIFLPEINGFEILERIKQDRKTKNIPVIILSNCGGESDIKKGIKLGAIAYLVKADTELEDIRSKVQDVLGL